MRNHTFKDLAEVSYRVVVLEHVCLKALEPELEELKALEAARDVCSQTEWEALLKQYNAGEDWYGSSDPSTPEFTDAGGRETEALS